MKIFIALALVTLCQAGPLENSADSRLSAPNIIMITIRDENFLLFEFEWTPVKGSLWTGPVIGYKMRVWEVPDAPSAKAKEFTLADGKYTVQMEQLQDAEESLDVTKDLENVLLAETRTPADLLTAPYFNVRIGVNYEIRVAAFTQNAQSTYSNFVRIRMLPVTPNRSSNSEFIKITSEDLKL